MFLIAHVPSKTLWFAQTLQEVYIEHVQWWTMVGYGLQSHPVLVRIKILYLKLVEIAMYVNWEITVIYTSKCLTKCLQLSMLLLFWNFRVHVQSVHCWISSKQTSCKLHQICCKRNANWDTNIIVYNEPCGSTLKS